MTKLWIIEDNVAYRRGIERALRGMDGIDDVRTFVSCEEAFAALAEGATPDVVLLDVGLPGMDGIESLGLFKEKAPDASFVVLTVFEDEDKIFRAVCAGASGYLLKSEPTERVLDAIRQVQAGGSPMHPRVARRVLTMFSKLAPAKSDFDLTPRETQVLQMMVEGAVKKQIADKIGLNPHTVDYTTRCIYRKLHVNCQAAAVSRAVKSGLFR